MKVRAAAIYDLNQPWEVVDMEVADPQAGEVLVNWKVAGMCHSDEHMVTGDLVPPREVWPLMGIENFFPVVGGHEGAGVVRRRRRRRARACRSATTSRPASSRRAAAAGTARLGGRTSATWGPAPSARG